MRPYCSFTSNTSKIAKPPSPEPRIPRVEMFSTFPSPTIGKTPVVIHGHNFGPLTPGCNTVVPGPSVLQVNYGGIYDAICCSVTVLDIKITCETNK